MYWLKVCPRCRGDLYEKEDRYGWYIACLQCGYHLTGDEEEVALASRSGKHNPRLPRFKSPDETNLSGGPGPYRHRKGRDPREKGDESRYIR